MSAARGDRGRCDRRSLVFTTPPVGSTGGVNFGTSPVVTGEDAGGNTVPTANTITLSLTAASGATLDVHVGSRVRRRLRGVATFTGCKIDLASSRTLTATSTTGGFTVVSAAVVTAVGADQRSSCSRRRRVARPVVWRCTQPVVTVQDAGGNTVTTGEHDAPCAHGCSGGAALTCTPARTRHDGRRASRRSSVARSTLASTYTLTATDDRRVHSAVSVGALGDHGRRRGEARRSRLSRVTRPVAWRSRSPSSRCRTSVATRSPATAAARCTLAITGAPGSVADVHAEHEPR